MNRQTETATHRASLWDPKHHNVCLTQIPTQTWLRIRIQMLAQREKTSILIVRWLVGQSHFFFCLFLLVNQRPIDIKFSDIFWHVLTFSDMSSFSDCGSGSCSCRVTSLRPRGRSTGWGWTSSRRPLPRMRRGRTQEVTPAWPPPPWPRSASDHRPRTRTDNTSDISEQGWQLTIQWKFQYVPTVIQIWFIVLCFIFVCRKMYEL